MIRIPPYLQKGDTIGMVAPAGYMLPEKVQTCMHILREWGYHIKVGNTVDSHSHNYFSGTDKERLQDFQDLLDDPEVKGILCVRGGYGIGRIIDRLRFKKFKKNPKWIIGYSDVTIMHSHIHTNYQIATLHAPMAAAFNDEEWQNEFVQSLKFGMEGEKIKYQVTPHEFNRKGEAIGELIGGNLSLLAHLVGTSSDIKTRGKILFLEDVGEYLYNIDRMLYQLKRAGKLEKLAGLIIGSFSDCKDTERPFGKTAYEIIRELVSEYEYPVCYGFPVGHTRENYALKLGIGYKLKVAKSKVTLEE